MSLQKSLFPRLVSLLCCSLLLVSYAASAAGEETIYTATYKGEYSGWRLEMTRKLIQTGERDFILRSVARSSFASIDETSVFKVEKDLFWPQHYTYKRRIFGKSSEEKIAFNWLNKTASYQRTGRKESGNQPIKPGQLDPALYQLQMQKELANGQQQFSYDFIKRKDTKHYNFAVTGKESFTVNKKAYNAVVIEREGGDNTRKTRVWLLPELDFQIARIQQKEESGETYSIELISYSADSDKVAQFYQRQQPLNKTR